ncbi:MAG: glucose 1-dehydrogenase [Nitrososphaerota archaeon]|nr:glucose 1-dehydrogenase [Nitrososphaerota archaeon]MDG7049469.1 glucose 1-dehydrogenase [Nitrososphaerota archaeon]MDG7052125.1 glucose 1-dehydrogenase [Nitrososphaerota archaeon]
MKLAGKVAIVTGGARGIGSGIAKAFASEGANVAIADLDYEGALAASMKFGESAFAIKADVSIKIDVETMVKSVIKKYGRIDILVNNAGIQTVMPFLDLSRKDWKRVLDVNLSGAFLCSQSVAKEMIRKRINGVIINISSIHGYIPRSTKLHYDVSKAGLIMLTKETALELAPYHIRVNCIAPGIIDTPMNQELLRDPEKRKMIEQRVPLEKIGSADDVARAALFLASDDSSYITGAALPVDGGLSLNYNGLKPVGSS